jgi:hypothetical protein
MKTVIDDLPVVLASRLRALGDITAETKATTVRLGDIEYVVGVALHRFPNGGSWSKFRCSKCGCQCQKLRLFEDRLVCGGCCRAAGLHYRIEMFSHASKRAAYTAPKRIARLNSAVPQGIKRGRDRLFDRRANLEAKLRRSLIVARQFAIDEHNKMLED